MTTISDLGGDNVTYTTPGTSALLDAAANAALTGITLAALRGGRITVHFENGGQTSDGLGLNYATNFAPGTVTLFLGQLYVNAFGVGAYAVGTVSGGTLGSDLVITFNNSSNVSLEAAQVLLHSLTFKTTATGIPERTISVTVTDRFAEPSAAALVTVNQTAQAPSVASVSAISADGSYKTGDTITLAVAFDQAVTVDTSGGTPTLLLETGAVDRYASYVSGSGTGDLRFSYTVQAGDRSGDLDYASAAALALNGASIRTGSLDAALALPAAGGAHSIAGQHAIVVDGVPPAITALLAPAAGTYKAGETLDFAVQWDEAVTVDAAGGIPRLAISLDSGTAYAAYHGGSGTDALTFRLAVAPGQLDLTGISISGLQANGAVLRDSAGNLAALALHGADPTNSLLIDGSPDTDGDGSSQATEDGVGGLWQSPRRHAQQGDGNGDGTLDSKQANVTSFKILVTPTAESGPAGAEQVYATLAAGRMQGTFAHGVRNPFLGDLAQGDAPDTLPGRVDAPLGELSFTAQIARHGATQEFSLYLDPALEVDGFWVRGATGHWWNLAPRDSGKAGYTRLDFTIKDGGYFDADGVADGVITVVGVPGHLAAA